jgi:hypothetical protein
MSHDHCTTIARKNSHLQLPAVTIITIVKLKYGASGKLLQGFTSIYLKQTKKSMCVSFATRQISSGQMILASLWSYCSHSCSDAAFQLKRHLLLGRVQGASDNSTSITSGGGQM